MKLLIAITLTPEQIRKIAWNKYGQWTSELPDRTECKAWLEQQLQTRFNEISVPSNRQK